MLVLLRRAGEEVVIRTPEGREVRVQVLDGEDRGRVRLGFAAEQAVRIDRAETLVSRRPQVGGQP